MQEITGHTRLFGIVADPIYHVKTPQRMNEHFARIGFDGVPARPLEGAGEAAIEHALDLARVALAGEQAGAARRIFDITVEYLKTRVQSGRPIGGFQAIKHGT